ncbi:hypothetical protein SORBI_3004G276000 [Sorghum bicolor]|uniref:Uncharacterized protein n=1 Tax=Sorghum bicolor TaxID=4558 RepID=A0A194YS24_SORBI|nr:hypothetical protein SORBI_3004G276000 [Sorghum bicolor]
MLLYSKLIYGYLNPGTRRLTEVQDSFLMDGWSQLSWTFLVGSGQTKAERDGGQVQDRKQRERSSAHCIHHSTLNFDLPGALRNQNPMPPSSRCLSAPCYTHVKHPVPCGTLLFLHLPMFYPYVWWRTEFGKVKYAVQISKTEKSA